MPQEEAEKVGTLAVLAFACEVAMLVILVAAGQGMASGWHGWALGMLLALVAVCIWGFWMAPTSTNRLENPTRFVAQAALFNAVAIAAVLGGLQWWGIGFGVLSIGVFAALIRDPA